MRYELYKFFIKQKGLLLFLLFILLKILMVLSNGYESHYLIDDQEDIYIDYMNRFSGKITEEKTDDIKEEYDVIYRSEIAINNLARQRAEQEITDEEYQEKSLLYYNKQRNKTVFEVFYSKYKYAEQMPEERYLLDSRGWETLLTRENLDFVLLFCLIILITPVFCVEYESGMTDLLLTCRRGKYRTGVQKIILGILVSLAAGFMFECIQFLYLFVTVGVPHGNYPLQSLIFFKDSIYQYSLQGTYFISFILKLLGVLMLTGFIMLISVLCRKIIQTFIYLSVLIVFPVILFSSGELIYYLPVPTGLFKPAGYFWPSSYMTDFDEKGVQYQTSTFREISQAVLFLLAALFFFETILLFLFVVKRYSQYHFHFKKKSVYKTASALILLSCLLTGGCGRQTVLYQDEDFYYEGNKLKAETDNLIIDLDVIENNIYITDKQNGSKEPIIRDVFPNDLMIRAVYIRDNYCFYLSENDSDTGIRIYQIELGSLKTSLIYNTMQENEEDFYGMLKETDTAEAIFENMENTNCFFLNENYIYYKKDSKIVQIKRKSKKEKVIVDDVSALSLIAYYKGKLLYIDNQYRLKYYDEQVGSIQSLHEIYTKQFELNRELLCYIDLFSNQEESILLQTLERE